MALVIMLVVVGAGVRAPTMPPNNPPGAAVVAGTAVLEAPAASMQLGFEMLKYIIINSACSSQSLMYFNDKTDLSWWGWQSWLVLGSEHPPSLPRARVLVWRLLRSVLV